MQRLARSTLRRQPIRSRSIERATKPTNTVTFASWAVSQIPRFELERPNWLFFNAIARRRDLDFGVTHAVGAFYRQSRSRAACGQAVASTNCRIRRMTAYGIN